MVISLELPVAKLSGVGPTMAARLEKLDIFTIRDLLYYFPFRYEDLSNVKTVSELELGEVASVKAKVWQITKFRTRTGKTIIKAILNDGSSSIDAIWFNQDYLLTVLKPNLDFIFSGKVGVFSHKKTLQNPKYEIQKNDQPIHTSRLVPIYSETSGVSSKWLRARIFSIFKLAELKIEELLPPSVIQEQNLVTRLDALKNIHFPNNFQEIEKARERFIFEELFILQLRNQLAKSREAGIPKRKTLQIPTQELEIYEASLPFQLTNSQKKAVKEILTDLQSGKPMNRLLQGEVGSGKTIVGSFAILTTFLNGFQSALMAPTEILAQQHYQTLNKFLGKRIKIGLVTSSNKYKGEDFDVLVGTHALLNKDLPFENLDLIVVDEQQRFGVAQRSFLRTKGIAPNFLTMTATPIPRTLALTVYGELEISVIEELPSKRKSIKTYFVPRIKRESAYNFISKEINKGGQAFILCPLIDQSETLTSVKAATSEFATLQKEVFKEFKLGLLHGKLKSKEKEKIIEDFRKGRIQILVTTPVVEVGIDIPTASVIAIEAAERFGLSSLHQLRGRVGRGERQSYCLLFTEKNDEKTLSRLKLMEKSNNGLELAELDLKLRGPGDIFGNLQHGQIDLKLAEQASLELIVNTKKEAEKLSMNQLTPELLKLIEQQSAESNLGYRKD